MRKRLLSLGVVTVIIVACGDDTIQTDGGNDSSTGNDGTTNDSGGNDTGGNDATTNDSGDSGGNDSGGGDAPSDVAQGDGGGGGLKCGTATCAAAQACCVNPGGPTYTCEADGGVCGAGSALLHCNSNADCSSATVCCLDASGGKDPPVATCSATCNGNGHAVLCDPNGTSTSNRCGDASACGNTMIDTWQLTTNYGTCGDRTGPF
jgi:hypothetical protein